MSTVFSILLNNINVKDGINSWRYILDLESVSSRPTDPWLAQRFWTTFNWFRCPMLIFEDSGCWWLSWPKLSPASQNCHQHISSQTCISDAVTDAASPVGEASSYKNMFDSNFSCVPHLIHLSKNPWNPVYTVWSSLKPKLKTSLFAWLFAYYENKFPKHK